MVKDKLFLLSVEETDKYLTEEESRKCTYVGDPFCWLLRSPGYNSNNVANVYSNGFLSCFGSDIDISISMIRPALYLNPAYLKSLEHKDKGCVHFAHREWLVLNEETGMLLSKNAVCLHRFDKDSNNYEQSEIRAYLNDELHNMLFTDEEQRMIVDTVIDDEKSYPAAA